MPAVPAFADLIGTPFAYGGRGAALDCFGLVKTLLQRAGVNILEQDAPDNLAVQAENIAHERLRAWARVKPGPGTVILFKIYNRQSQRDHVCHMGFQISDLDFIHTWQGTGGVTIEPLAHWAHRVDGHYVYAP